MKDAMTRRVYRQATDHGLGKAADDGVNAVAYRQIPFVIRSSSKFPLKQRAPLPNVKSFPIVRSLETDANDVEVVAELIEAPSSHSVWTVPFLVQAR